MSVCLSVCMGANASLISQPIRTEFGMTLHDIMYFTGNDLKERNLTITISPAARGSKHVPAGTGLEVTLIDRFKPNCKFSSRNSTVIDKGINICITPRRPVIKN
jgi:hypothetical protein